MVASQTITTIAALADSDILGLAFNPMESDGPVRIYVAKLLAALSLAGMILAMSLPAAGACYLMGGLSLFGESCDDLASGRL